MNWRRFFARRTEDAEQQEEIESYLDLTAKEYVERGMDPSEARAAARRKLGNPALIREEVYHMNTLTFLESALYDVRYALRTIRTKPGFSVIALLSLALGIGANIAIFSVVNAVLIRPLPYPDSAALLGVFNSGVIQGESFADMPLSAGMYNSFKDSVQTFQSFGVWTPEAATVTGLGDPEQVSIIILTQGVFPALGVRPHIGRWFSKEDDTPGTPETVVLSYGYWQRRFGGDPGVLGRNILVNFVPRQVIGVMPRNFQFLNIAPDMFLPSRFSLGETGYNDLDQSGIGRLKAGVALAQANQDIARALRICAEQNHAQGVVEAFHLKPNLRPLKNDVVGNIGGVLGVLMGVLALVLLLVCANVANLVLVRARSRRQEFAIRAALGAGWSRIARELLIESLTLGVLGGAFGIALAYAGLRLLVAQGPATLPRLSEISIDSTSVVFALVCSLGSSLFFGSIAILKCRLPGRLQAARGITADTNQLRTQNVLVVAQVALSLVLLVAAGLIVRSFLAMRAVSPGFTHPEQIQTARIAIPETQIPEPERATQMQKEIISKLTAVPGVTAAAFSSCLPMDPGHRNGILIRVEGKTPPDQLPPNRVVEHISPGLFNAQGTRLITGRDFTWDEVVNRRLVAIVSENMARENWGDPRTALGKRIQMGNDGVWSSVVGVVENVYQDGVQQAPPTIVYFPAARRGVSLAIRSSRAGTQAFVREISAAIHSVNASMPLAEVRTLNDVYRLSMARTSFTLVLLGIAGAMALTLAIIGVYGVLAYAVAQRRREVSIRVALGAEPKTVRSLFVRRGLVLACAGGFLGLVSAAALSRWIASLLYGVTPLDPITYGFAAAVILMAALIASYVPASRAASVDPMETLRAD